VFTLTELGPRETDVDRLGEAGWDDAAILEAVLVVSFCACANCFFPRRGPGRRLLATVPETTERSRFKVAAPRVTLYSRAAHVGSSSINAGLAGRPSQILYSDFKWAGESFFLVLASAVAHCEEFVSR